MKRKVERATDWHSARFCNLPPHCPEDERLTLIHYRLMAYIGRVGKAGGWCTFSQKEVAELFKCARQTVNIAVGDLVVWRYFEKRTQQETKSALCEYRTILERIEAEGDVSSVRDTPLVGDVSPVHDTRVIPQVTPVSVASTDTLLVKKHKKHYTPKPPMGACDGFDKFWEEYPKGKRSRQAKAKARDLYRKAIKSGEITEQGLLEAIRWYGLSKPDPDFIPMPSTWLNGKRWEDDNAKPRGIAANSSKGEFTPEPAKVLPTDRQLKAPVWKETPVRRWFRADTPEFNHHVSELIKTGSHAEAKRVQQAGRVLAYPLTAAGDVVQRIVGKVAAKSDNRLAGVL